MLVSFYKTLPPLVLRLSMMRINTIEDVANFLGKIIAINANTNVCPVIGTGKNGRGIKICAIIANIAVNIATSTKSFVPLPIKIPPNTKKIHKIHMKVTIYCKINS